MNELDSRIREAFDGVSLPASVKQQTLQAIDRLQDEQTPAVPASVAAAARRTRAPRTRRFAIALAACLALCAIGFGGFTAFASETAQVGIDINPSIELGLNRFDCVVSARPINEDGERLLAAVDLEGKSYDEAMAVLAGSGEFQSYIASDGYVEISVTSSDAGQAASLTKKSDAYLESLPCHGVCRTVSVEHREEAVSAGMGAGRYSAALELMELDPSITLEDCRSMSMRELRDRIVEAGGEGPSSAGRHHGQSSGMGDGRGAGSGQGERRGQGAG